MTIDLFTALAALVAGLAAVVTAIVAACALRDTSRTTRDYIERADRFIEGGAVESKRKNLVALADRLFDAVADNQTATRKLAHSEVIRDSFAGKYDDESLETFATNYRKRIGLDS